MKFNSKEFPILKQFDPKTANTTNWITKDVRWELKYFLNHGHKASLYLTMMQYISKRGMKNIDYVTLPIIKIIDDDPVMCKKLWALRDELSQPEYNGVLLMHSNLQYVYSIKFNSTTQTFHCFVMQFAGSMFLNASTTSWEKGVFPALIYDPVLSFDVMDNVEGHDLDFPIQMVVTYLVFKEYAQPDIKYVSKFSTNKQVIFNNSTYTNKEFPFKINVVDSNYFRTIIRTEGFGVKGHFRLQACGEGRGERRITWINSFEKKGYKRIAKIAQTT
jgi:hypothetical protein